MSNTDSYFAESRDIAPPPLESRWVRLRTVEPNDYPFLYELALSSPGSFRWRFRGSQPSFEEFVRSLSSGVFMQYVIVSAKTPRRLGLVVGYRADFRNRTIYLALQAAPVTFTRGWALHGAELFINYLFSCYDFHKIYAESPEFVVESFRAELGTNFVQEGCLRENERFMGRAWDTYIFAYYRSNWEKEDSNIRRRLRIGRQRGSKVSEDGNPLTYEAFQKYLETQLSLDFQSISPETKFVDDLQFDSIRMLELLCVIEDLDVELDDNALVSINTVDEAFFHYIQSTGKRRQ